MAKKKGGHTGPPLRVYLYKGLAFAVPFVCPITAEPPGRPS